jgi:hypothetical protein
LDFGFWILRERFLIETTVMKTISFTSFKHEARSEAPFDEAKEPE